MDLTAELLSRTATRDKRFQHGVAKTCTATVTSRPQRALTRQVDYPYVYVSALDKKPVLVSTTGIRPPFKRSVLTESYKYKFIHIDFIAKEKLKSRFVFQIRQLLLNNL
jgi:hypothetical protein